MSTQTTNPGRATVRTVVQTVIGGVLALGIVLPIAWNIVRDEVAKQGLALPAEVVGAVGAVIAVVVVVSASLARIMAIPQVDALLRRFRLSADPEVEPKRALDD